MKFEVLRCPYCGSEGEARREGDFWFCAHCGLKFTDDGAERAYKKLAANIGSMVSGAIDEALLRKKEEEYYNLRSNLWDKVHAKYTDSRAIIDICRSIKKIEPHDFLASFFEVANGDSLADTAEFVEGIDVNENELFIDLVIDFMLKSLTSEYVAPTNYLIERAYRNSDLEKFEEYITKLEEEAKKVDGGIYETMLPRDVFIAYSSRDMDKVLELMRTLEANGLTCFVAMRNLQHGRGAVENYERALHEAIDNSQILVFVSSKNSRSFACDAFKKELSYIKNKELQNAPIEYKNSYARLPDKYKKPRIEYRLDNVKTVAADIFMKEFFAGLDYCESMDKVLERIVAHMMAASEPEEEPAESSEAIEARIRAEYEAKMQAQKEADARLRAEEEAARLKAESEELKRRLEEEKEAAKARVEAEAAKAKADAEAKAEAEALRKRLAEESAARLKAENEALRPKQEANAKASSEVTAIAANSAKNNKENAPATSAAPKTASDPGAKAPMAKPADPIEKYKNIFTIEKNVNGEYVLKSARNVLMGNIEIPEEIAEIGQLAFCKCADIKSISIKNPNTRIGSSAFSDCLRLESINIPTGIDTIPQYAFVNCHALKSIYLPDNVKHIEKHAFAGAGLRSIRLSSALLTIKADAFDGCELEEISIPESVTEIAAGAFKKCKALKKLAIPERFHGSLRDIFPDSTGLSAMFSEIAAKRRASAERTEALRFFEVKENNDGALCAVRFTKTDAKIVRVPRFFSSIGAGAFSENREISSLTIEEDTKSIGDRAFENCEALRSVLLPMSLKLIGNATFKGCKSLGEITIPNTVTEIPESAFEGCASLRKVNVPKSVLKIGKNAFRGCAMLERVTLNADCKLEDGAFADCPKLMISGITNIPPAALGQVANAPAPKSQNFISEGKNTKQKDDKKDEIKKPVTLSLEEQIKKARKIFKIDVQNGKLIISKLIAQKTDIVIPSFVDSIAPRAFATCMSLNSVEFENGVTEIPDEAFAGCINLRYVALSNTIVKVSSTAFIDCNSIRSFKVSTYNRYIVAIVELLAYTATSNLTDKSPYRIIRAANQRALIIPDTVRRIEPNAFKYTKVDHVKFASPSGWEDTSKRLFNKISEKKLKDPIEAAKLLKEQAGAWEKK